jgi:tetratricopeptide (TPR) repeat protein
MTNVRVASDGWRDISWFDALLARVATGGGELWFVTGNMRGVLDQVRRRARDAPGCVVVGPEAPPAGDEVVEGLRNAAGVAAALLNPLAELALVLGDLAKRILRERGRQLPPDPSDVFGYFDDLVEAAAVGGETVVFIVVADNRSEDLWSRRFAQYTARGGRLARQPVVLIVGLVDAPADPSEVDDASPALVRDAAALVAAGKAQWRWVPPLRSQDVCEVMQASGEAARLLAMVTGGDDRLAAQRWERWVAHRVVTLDPAGTWSLAGAPTDHVLQGIEKTMDRVFGTDRDRIDRAQLALMLAASVGDEFCCESVLRALVSAGEAYDAAEDDLDALVHDDATPGLLHSSGHDPNRPGGRPEHLWRYGFDDPLVAAYYRGVASGEPDRERFVRSLVANLTDVRLHDGRFDVVIGRLAREVGDVSTARMIEQRIATREELDQIDTDASVLLALADRWDPADIYLCEQLNVAAERFQGVGRHDLAVPCSETALRLARTHPDPPLVATATALLLLGQAYEGRGSTHQALTHLNEALRCLQTEFDQRPTATVRQGLAVTLHHLGSTHAVRGEQGEAIQYGTQAVRHLRVLLDQRRDPASRRGLAMGLYDLGRAFKGHGDAAPALDALAEARDHFEALFGEAPTPTARRELALTLHQLGSACSSSDSDRAAVHLTAAREHLQMLYDAQPTPDHRGALAITLTRLGAVERNRHDLDEALRHLSDALGHLRVLLDEWPDPSTRRDLALVLYELGLAHGANGSDEEVGYLAEATLHLQALFDQQPTPGGQHELGVMRTFLGRAHLDRGEPNRAIDQLMLAIEHLRHPDVVERPAAEHHRAVGLALHPIGVAYLELGDREQAVHYLTEALRCRQELYDQQPTATHREELDATMDWLRETKDD